MKSAIRNTPTAMARLRASSTNRRNGVTGITIISTIEMMPTGNAMLDSVAVSVLTSVAVLTSNACCDLRASPWGCRSCPPSAAEPVDEGKYLGDGRVEVDGNRTPDANSRCQGSGKSRAPNDVDPVLLGQSSNV